MADVIPFPEPEIWTEYDAYREALDETEPCDWELQEVCTNHQPAHFRVIEERD